VKFVFSHRRPTCSLKYFSSQSEVFRVFDSRFHIGVHSAEDPETMLSWPVVHSLLVCESWLDLRKDEFQSILVGIVVWTGCNVLNHCLRPVLGSWKSLKHPAISFVT
jgi:hypothetical protein